MSVACSIVDSLGDNLRFLDTLDLGLLLGAGHCSPELLACLPLTCCEFFCWKLSVFEDNVDVGDLGVCLDVVKSPSLVRELGVAWGTEFILDVTSTKKVHDGFPGLT